MSIALYRKYRPQKFSDIVNQNHIVVSLTNQIKDESFTQAYLFSGPRGLGKTTIARLFAKALNCQKRKIGAYEPCNDCASCKSIAENNSLEMVEIDAASHTGVDNVRENIISASRSQSGKGKRKIFIIDEVHMLSTQAFNALLKTLEEPPLHAVFILATTEIHKVPATIISRCQRFDFKKVSAEDIIRKLKLICKMEKKSVDDEVLKLIAIQSEGCIRDSQSLLDQVFSLGLKKIDLKSAELFFPSLKAQYLFDFFENLGKRNTKALLEQIAQMADEGMEFQFFTEKLVQICHRALLFKIEEGLANDGIDFDPRQEKRFLEASEFFDSDRLVSIIQYLIDKEALLKEPNISRIVMELAAVELTRPEHKIEVLEKQGKDKLNEMAFQSKKVQDQPDAEIKKTPIESSDEASKLRNFKNKWGEFLNLVKEQNSSLAFILKISKPIDFAANKLRVAVKYRIHQEKINERKVRNLMEKLLSEVSGEKVEVECVLDAGDGDSSSGRNQDKAPEQEAPKKKNEEKGGITSKIASIFQGKIIEEK